MKESAIPPDKRKPVICLISLGCSKNQVDSERILGNLVRRGFLVAGDPADADICLVNTCGFVDDARQETAQVLGELHRLKKEGLKAVIALGCMVERANASPELRSFLNQADLRIGFNRYKDVPELCEKLLTSPSPPMRRDSKPGRLHGVFMEGPRLRIGFPHTAYLKISEGCSNSCAFCSIPLIRGRQISRSIESIVAEARTLIDSGARELNLIAQDTTSYGLDRYGRRSLPKLLQALLELTDRVWFRLMYAFPNHLSNDVLDVMASDSRVCPYLDMPLQHINDRLLQSMGRRITRDGIRRLLEKVRARMPSGAIRTAFIVGFPGETDDTFGELLEFVHEGWFSHMGIFTYSPEPGTPAARLHNSIPESVKESYRDRLMMAQLENSRRRLKTFIGSDLEVLVEGRLDKSKTGPKGLQYVSRSRLDAPEVDGVVYLKGNRPAFPGEFICVRVVESLDYDLIAEVP